MAPDLKKMPDSELAVDRDKGEEDYGIAKAKGVVNNE